MTTIIVFLSGVTVGSLFHVQIVAFKNKCTKAVEAARTAYNR